jgi:hypothetical protein
MLDLNNVSYSDDGPRDFELIPDGTVARAFIKLSGGDHELPEFGGGTYFKSSQSGAKWMPIELTIVGGPYDKRKVWQNIFVDGAKTDQNGFSIAKRIGLETIKKMVDSHFALDMKDVSPEAAQKRGSINGVHMLNGMQICFKIGIEKGSNGYADKNKIKTVLTPGSQEFIAGDATAVAPAATPTPQAAAAPSAPATANAAGVTPTWAR